ncbi:MAG: galactitol-1-phosphate 5-dehydrogenase [Chloroflexi bacterium]|nr:galactitol-1-phosphate 5-dehydrogenase [Chloroflexota bacterium]
MKALVYEGAWQMPMRDVPIPEPGTDQVQVKVETVGVCGSDVHGFKGTTGRRKPPIIMGHEFSGTITAAGAEVKNFLVGDRVVVTPLLTCGYCDNCRAGFPNICQNRSGLGVNLNGAYADYVSVSQKMVFPLPGEMSWEQGALVEPLAVAMHAVNLTPMQLMDTVVIIGAGTIGLLTILAAKMKGAGKIIVSDVSAHRLDFAKRLGADVVVNPAKEDAIDAVKQQTNGKGAPAVIEAVGITATTKQSLFMARNGGNVVWIGNSDPEITINMQQIVTRELTVRGTYGFNDEFGLSIEAIRTQRIDPTGLIEKRAALADGSGIINDLAKGNADWIKVMLKP